jgi:hypothetical protein
VTFSSVSRLVILGTVLGLVGGLAMFFLSKTAETVVGNLRIGSLEVPVFCTDHKCKGGEEILFEDPKRLMGILRARYRVREAKLGRVDYPYLYSVRAGEIPELIRLTVKGRSPEGAQEFLEEIVSWTADRHDRLYQDRIERIDAYTETLRQTIAELALILGHKKGLKEEGCQEGDDESTLVSCATANLIAIAEQNGNTNRYHQGRPTELLSMSVSEAPAPFSRLVFYLFSGLSIGIMMMFSAKGILEFILEWRGKSNRDLDN